ncbi:uncharacterized protein F5Z01DRAFT_641671 [Emericellopsis atlantica]|uniref:NAD(P)-binding protein n=1 Tax=Emericellopsis atlantica TaxID=2614577 RepID=A0A9P7ZVA8_9HYPO|nr:uncharacterized protein F5Z01DRAFT_641671 [Emericellopsis atlantica]KAG9258880.1 hypothetical protein F5Z01DRAFT_641671 [Emericellopsis atlantica]
MSSYVITGVSKGLGWEFLTQLSANSDNLIIGIVRNKAATDTRVKDELPDRNNIHILEADMTDYQALKAATDKIPELTHGALDYIIANAGVYTDYDAYTAIGGLANDPEGIEREILMLTKVNVIANIHLFNLLIPLIKKGKAKKVITITTGHADLDVVIKHDIEVAPFYAASKAHMNLIVGKFSAQYKREGILFLSLSPGAVDVGKWGKTKLTEEQAAAFGATAQKFMAYAPDWKGPITPEESIRAMLNVIDKASIENGDAGEFLSHWGNKQWL